jgi:hypothetical protein
VANPNFNLMDQLIKQQAGPLVDGLLTQLFKFLMSRFTMLTPDEWKQLADLWKPAVQQTVMIVISHYLGK